MIMNTFTSSVLRFLAALLLVQTSYGDVEHTTYFNEDGTVAEPAPPPPSPALHVAALRGDVARVAALLEGGAAVDATDSKGRTALHEAAANGKTDALRALLTGGAAVDGGDTGNTPLMDASWAGELPAVEALLAAGADVNRVDRGKDYALLFAAYHGHEETIGALCDAGATADLQNEANFTALMIALNSVPRKESVRRLLACGASTGLTNRDGRTAVDLGCDLERNDMDDGDSRDICDMLIAHHEARENVGPGDEL